MAREVSKKKKKTSSAKSSPKTRKQVNYDIVAIIMIAIGIFVGVSMFTNITGVVGECVKNLLLYHTEDTHLDNRRELYSAEGKQYYNGNLVIPFDGESIKI